MTERNKKAIIIGAGPAGLAAAYSLLTETEDVKPILFEASDVVGGIARTAFFGKNGVDIGGHRLFSKSQTIVDLWEYFLPDEVKHNLDPETVDIVMMRKKRFSEILYLRKLFAYPISMSAQTFKNLGLKRTLLAGFSYLKSIFFKVKENNLEDFMVNRFGRVLYELFFESYTEKVWGRHPRNISKEWGEQRIKGLSLVKAVLSALKLTKNKETSLIDEFSYPKYGCTQLWNLMSGKIIELGGEIRYNSEVISVETDGNIVKSVKIRDNNGEYSENADYVMSSMPVRDLVMGMNDVDEDVKKVAEELPYRDYMLVGLYLNDMGIKENGKLSKDSWIYIQEPDVKVGRMQIMNNWSKYLVEDENKVLISLEYFCDEGDEFWNMSDDDFVKFAIEEGEKIGILKKEDVIDSLRLRVKKAYPAYFGTYSEFDKIQKYLDKFDNLFCIGRNGQHRYNNLDHSMLTGMEAVKIIKGESDKKSLWSINAEQEYHESK